MTGTPINLNKARKAKTRADADTLAQANRVKFGRTKAEKQASRIEADRLARDLDGRKRDR